MNKLLMDNNAEEIIITQKSNHLALDGNYTITIFNQPINTLTIKAKAGAQVLVNDFRLIKTAKTKINLTAEQDANLIYNHAFINEGTYDLIIKANYLATGSNITVNLHGINDTGQTNLQINGLVELAKINNFLSQNIKLINLNGGTAKAMPNMLIKTAKVIANHNVTIGRIEMAELQYLMSKGLSEPAAKKLILNGFLVKVINEPKMTIKIKELIGGR